MDLTDIVTLLGTEDLPGTPEELAILATRIEELVRLNGRQWVIEHRRQLITEWDFIVNKVLIQQP